MPFSNIYVDYPTSSSVKETNSSSQQQHQQHEEEEEQPQPSTSYGKLGELMSIFPNLKSNILAEFLSLAHDDVSWATTLILDNRTTERVNQREDGETNQCMVEGKISSDEQLSLTYPSTSSLHTTTTVCSPPTTNDMDSTATNEACSIRQEDNPIDFPLVSQPSCQEDNHSSSFNHCGIKLSRGFLKSAHEEYAFSLGLSHVDLSPEAVPDFLINEWIPEPNLTKEIYISIMRHLGVLVNNNSTGNNTLTPTFLSTSNTRNTNEIKAKKTATKSKIPSSSFLQIMHDEEGLLRSVEDFRTSLNTPVIRIIMDRLMSKFPGTQKSVIEEAFVRCEFDEARTEIYLLSYYKSASELTEKTNTTAAAAAATATTNVADLSSTSTVSGLSNDFRDVSLHPATITTTTTSTTTTNNNNNLNGLLIGQQSVEENLSLQEIQDEEEALNRSIEDQKVRLQTLANQLCLSRLKAQFPGIEINYLENLFIRFDLNEQNLMDYFIKQGFIPQPLNPFLVETSNKFNENVDTDMMTTGSCAGQEYSSSHQVNSISSTNTNANNEWLNMLNRRIESIRQKIIHAKCDLSYAKDSRVKQFRVTELRSLQNELYYFNLQKAEYLVDTRSILYEEELLTNGERPISAACLAFSYLDLHGLNKSCALSVLQQRLSYLKDKLSMKNTRNSIINVPKYFTVITGRAAGCESDLVSVSPVLRPAVIQYLTKNGYKFEENFRIGSGHFTVNLNNNPSRLISKA
ncbi:unnamed protein product [Trichobilharzia szidati]|nr:unnamed protein product [Trichobilharzia szidati]